MLKTWFIRLLSLAAAVFSLFMLARTVKPVHDALRLTDPAGLQDVYLTLGVFLANACVIFLFGVLVWRCVKNKALLEKIPTPFVFAFVLKLFEAADLLPCMTDRQDHLRGHFHEHSCGTFATMISYMTAPLIIIITGRVLTGTKDRNVKMAGLVLMAVLAIVGATAWWNITPKNTTECGYISEISAQGNCMKVFALRNLDINICKQIDFRSTRYDCISEIAQKIRHPELCEEIQTPPGVKVSNFEAPASALKDLCYDHMALDLGNHDLCLKIQDGSKRQTCLDEATAPGAR